MEALKVSQTDWLGEATRYIQGGLHRIAYVEVSAPVVIVHRETQVDAEACKAMGYEVVESYNNGGTIVSNAGDILIGHFAQPDNGWHDRFVSYFLEWLKARGLNAEYTNNDILVDGFKVCGLCVTRYGRIDYTGGIISLNVNLDHIKAICRKPMVKVPKGLGDYGITTAEVEAMFLEFCEKDAQAL
jgi:lipoate-protein ligase A